MPQKPILYQAAAAAATLPVIMDKNNNNYGFWFMCALVGCWGESAAAAVE